MKGRENWYALLVTPPELFKVKGQQLLELQEVTPDFIIVSDNVGCPHRYLNIIHPAQILTLPFSYTNRSQTSCRFVARRGNSIGKPKEKPHP